jgi:hypothetical protein
MIIPVPDPTRRARLVIARPANKRPGRYWYSLVVVRGPQPPGTHLWSASAYRRVNPHGGPMQPDPDEREAAIAMLRYCVRDNRWTFEE